MSVLLPLLGRSFVQARYVLLGTACVLWGLQLVLVGQASAIEQQNSFGRMADLVPQFLQRGLGSRAMMLATFKGTVAFGYFHPIVVMLVAVIAAYLATEPAHEVEAGLVDLELARSLPRHVLITRSFLAAGAAIVSILLLMAAGTWLGLRAFATTAFDAPSPRVVALLMAHLACVAAVFAALGGALAAGARRWSTAFFTTALAAVALYLLDFLSLGWPVMRPLAAISPFHYYPALAIVAGDPAEWQNMAILLAATAVFCAAAYWRFLRRDL